MTQPTTAATPWAGMSDAEEQELADREDVERQRRLKALTERVDADLAVWRPAGADDGPVSAPAPSEAAPCVDAMDADANDGAFRTHHTLGKGGGPPSGGGRAKKLAKCTACQHPKHAGALCPGNSAVISSGGTPDDLADFIPCNCTGRKRSGRSPKGHEPRIHSTTLRVIPGDFQILRRAGVSLGDAIARCARQIENGTYD